MSESINLVSTNNSQLEKEQKRLRLVRVSAIVLLIGVAAISVLFFVIIITLPISEVKKDQQSTLSSISTLRQKLVKYSLINDRTRNISDILKKRANYGKASEAIINKVPDGISVDSIAIETGTVSLNISGKSLLPINDFINEMIKLGNDEKVIKNVILQSLILNSTSGSFTLTFKADII